MKDEETTTFDVISKVSVKVKAEVMKAKQGRRGGYRSSEKSTHFFYSIMITNEHKVAH